MKFTKMQGLGNDYIYINAFEEQADDLPALARRMSDRHFGVGGDGLVLIAPSDKADFRMIMYNGCCHPAELLAETGKELRIMGGIDKMQLKAGKDAIKAYLESVAPLVERGGYIPFCDHRCPPDVSEENYLYYLDLKEQMFGLK